MATIKVEIDDELKREAHEQFKQMGLSPSTAITLFFKAVKLHHGLPFKVTKKMMNEFKDNKQY